MRRPLTICSSPGCSQIVPGGKCPRHQAQAEALEAARQKTHDATRPTSGERGYDADWRAVRRQYLAAHPTCVGYGAKAGRCLQRASEVDHITSVAEAPELRLRWSNLRPMCKPCHSARTASEQSLSAARGGTRT